MCVMIRGRVGLRRRVMLEARHCHMCGGWVFDVLGLHVHIVHVLLCVSWSDWCTVQVARRVPRYKNNALLRCECVGVTHDVDRTSE